VRLTRLLSAAFLALTGCQAQEPAQSEPAQATSDPFGDELERMRHTPLESEVATNHEYAIAAVFPKGSPVCISDSGSHIHGFHQWLESDCTKEAPDVLVDRIISIWADYNAAEYSRERAEQRECKSGQSDAPFKISVPQPKGWTVTCRNLGDDGQIRVTAAFLATEPDRGFGPDRIHVLYSAGLHTDQTHYQADLSAFKGFLGKARLAGTSLTLGN
jgi:hypothetical protein